jgi:hypothetical protein
MTITEVPVEELEAVVGSPLPTWAGHCHQISLAIVRAEVFPGGRVARGTGKGVTSQHSWIVVGPDCYAPKAQIVDPTLFAYHEDIEGVWYGSAKDKMHTPHGSGSIWDDGRPGNAEPGQEVWLDKANLSEAAKTFLSFVEPLDYHGWCRLASLPVGGWPAAEIHGAIARDKRISGAAPIDIVGMLTDLNPNRLYLPGPDRWPS